MKTNQPNSGQDLFPDSEALPAYLEQLWVVNKPSAVTPSVEKTTVQRLRRRRTYVWLALMVCAALNAAFSVAMLAKTPDGNLFYVVSLICSIALIFPSGKFDLFDRIWPDYKAPTADVYEKDVNALHWELSKAFLLGVQFSAFEDRFPSPEVLRADLGSYLKKAALQIDTKDHGGLLVDAEKEREAMKMLHKAALPFGLVHRDRTTYYPPRR